MATLRIGYDLFAGSSQAGTDGGVGGNFQVETAKAGAYYAKVTRTADTYYWNNTTGAFTSTAVAEGDEILIPGSNALQSSAVRRLMFKLPEACAALIAATGFKVTAYATGDTPSSAGVDLTLEFAP